MEGILTFLDGLVCRLLLRNEARGRKSPSHSLAHASTGAGVSKVRLTEASPSFSFIQAFQVLQHLSKVETQVSQGAKGEEPQNVPGMPESLEPTGWGTLAPRGFLC